MSAAPAADLAFDEAEYRARLDAAARAHGGGRGSRSA